jgi:hypothetical protein
VLNIPALNASTHVLPIAEQQLALGETGLNLQASRVGLELQLLNLEQQTLKRLMDEAVPKTMNYLA